MRVAVPVDVSGHRFAVTVRKGLSTVAGAVSVVRRAFALAVVITLVLALALGLLIATRLVRRLRALRTAAMRVAELGPGVELHADGGRDEVGDLTRSFATMQKQLRAQEEARRTFVASASHELRTPLQSLLFMLDMLYEDLADEAPDLAHAREDVGRARAQAERLCGLSAELLDLSRLDAGVALRRERVELVGLCRSVVAEFEGRAIEANALIELIPAPAAWVVADPSAVVQIIRGLLDNALRFTHPGGRISVTPRPGTIAVADEGPGVPTHERDLIFERFRRGQDGGGGVGFGLGLAIGRELARRMDGDLSLDRAGPGARFVLRLAPVPSSAATGRELAREASER
ncbi:MAG: HAMP domain-containing histidine kinase [Solirubrobacterales bacterium]|nr:HAMP domain-containing histidine kinase [Solirubrobacterales bacterium]